MWLYFSLQTCRSLYDREWFELLSILHHMCNLGSCATNTQFYKSCKIYFATVETVCCIFRRKQNNQEIIFMWNYSGACSKMHCHYCRAHFLLAEFILADGKFVAKSWNASYIFLYVAAYFLVLGLPPLQKYLANGKGFK